MIFNSYIFILLFLPISIITYFVLTRTTKPPVSDWWLVFVSLIFYSFAKRDAIIFIFASLVVNYLFCTFIGKKRNSLSRILLAVSVVLNLCALFVLRFIRFDSIIVPLGISFITFEQIAYVVETYKGNTEGFSLSEYLLYVLWFPKISQGPLANPVKFVSSLRDDSRRKVNYDNIADGLFCISIGLFKKMFIADSISKYVDAGYMLLDYLGTASSLVVILGYTLQIYMDFSGYCDIAYGVSKMFNITLPVNFNSPYKAESVTEFWKRWHISLTDFLREYVYFPLGGSKKGKARTYINILLVFIVSGIWHGNTINFILWGLLHGVCQVIERAGKNVFSRINHYVKVFVTFVIVNIGWVLFRAPNLQSFLMVLRGVFRKTEYGSNFAVFMADTTIANSTIVSKLGLLGNIISDYFSVFVLTAGLIICFLFPNLYSRKRKNSLFNSVLCAVLLLISILSMSGAITRFIYFNF